MNKYEQKQELRREGLKRRASALKTQAGQAFDRARQVVAAIEPGQPILTDHYSAGRHRRALAASDSAMRKGIELGDLADEALRRADRVGTGGISADDPEAVRKLREQLTDLQERQERMKAANKVIRQHLGDFDAQKAGLLALGWLTEEEAADLLARRSYRGLGYPSFRLTNNAANIRRITLRIEEIRRTGEREDVAIEAPGYSYREDVSDNRLGFTFPVKPSLDVRNVLKAEGFRFSPSRGNAWVRQLTPAGISAGRRVREQLDTMNLPS